jgi:hypothetical protein
MKTDLKGTRRAAVDRIQMLDEEVELLVFENAKMNTTITRTRGIS